MSSNDISDMFHEESQKLENLINNAESNSELSIHEIVEMYYQVMNVSTMVTMLKQTNENPSLLDQISSVEKIISKKFNSNIHPKITEQLFDSIENLTKKLQSKTLQNKSKEDIESEAKQYEYLREIMSTKEFVKQYEDGLS
ncbi:MAG: hypothetical protein K5790_00880 [Nitrosopumilus sp.]|uniref:hypothetical protein n=1 Tax=Nitrosopumilus sp. TaxID=2024843 RepID=UPI00247B57CD|nr:hypothetical protein [Nitrosopumilus sp.]MCV0391829.1 hypothetical protein [Nitrosopumilus sp.]